MRKSTVVLGILCALFAFCAVISVIGCLSDIENCDVSFPIGYGSFSLIFGYSCYLHLKEKEMPLARLGLKRVLKFCRDPQKEWIEKSRKLSRFLNKREKFFFTICPVCNAVKSFASDKPCSRCKTVYKKDEDGFELSKSPSKHRLEPLFARDFAELKGYVEQYRPYCDYVAPSLWDDLK